MSRSFTRLSVSLLSFFTDGPADPAAFGWGAPFITITECGRGSGLTMIHKFFVARLLLTCPTVKIQ